MRGEHEGIVGRRGSLVIGREDGPAPTAVHPGEYSVPAQSADLRPRLLEGVGDRVLEAQRAALARGGIPDDHVAAQVSSSRNASEAVYLSPLNSAARPRLPLLIIRTYRLSSTRSIDAARTAALTVV
jgi:hypothetical protein